MGSSLGHLGVVLGPSWRFLVDPDPCLLHVHETPRLSTKSDLVLPIYYACPQTVGRLQVEAGFLRTTLGPKMGSKIVENGPIVGLTF